MRPNLFMPVLTLLIFASSHVRAGPVLTFTDIDEWRVAASAVGTGMVHEIDFETLPDGSPSVVGTLITPDFNYTDQGVTFSSPFPVLSIGGVPGFFVLGSQVPDTTQRNWIIADLVTPATAVGIFFPGNTTLSVFDSNDLLIGSASLLGGGGGLFLGIVSDVPIFSAIEDRGSSGESLESFLFTPVPEPGTFLLLAGGAAIVLRRRRRCISPLKGPPTPSIRAGSAKGGLHSACGSEHGNGNCLMMEGQP